MFSCLPTRNVIRSNWYQMTIRDEQMTAFRDAARHSFESEMISHSADFAPHLCSSAGHANLELAVRKGIESSDRYGFTMRGPVRFYIEMVLTFGSDFDTDPQLP